MPLFCKFCKLAVLFDFLRRNWLIALFGQYLQNLEWVLPNYILLWKTRSKGCQISMLSKSVWLATYLATWRWGWPDEKISKKIIALNMYCSCPFKIDHCLSSGSSSSWSSSIFSISWREHPQVTCTTSLTLLLHDVVQLQGDLYYINLLVCSQIFSLHYFNSGNAFG